MIRTIKGTVIDRTMSAVVIQTDSGIGFEVFAPLRVIESLRLNEEATLHTYMQVKEDGMSLFGFSTKEELEIFKKLITVNGIGPKVAINILSSTDLSNLRIMIISEDIKSLSKIPGLGAKTAAKLVLELKGKIQDVDLSENGSTSVELSVDSTNIRKDAIDALESLGYSRADVLKALNKMGVTESTTVEDLIKFGLRTIGF